MSSLLHYRVRQNREFARCARRADISVSRANASRRQPFSEFLPASGSLRPQVFGTSKISCSRGLRMSASIASTGRFISASAMAILLTTVVFPSSGNGLVTTMILGLSPFCPAKRIEVRAARKHSACNESFHFQVTSSTEFSKASLTGYRERSFEAAFGSAIAVSQAELDRNFLSSFGRRRG